MCMWEQNRRNAACEGVRLSGAAFKQRKSPAVRNGLLFGRGITLEQIEISLWQRQVVASPCHPVCSCGLASGAGWTQSNRGSRLF